MRYCYLLFDSKGLMELDADVLLTGKDYENFRTIFEGFTSHQ